MIKKASSSLSRVRILITILINAYLTIAIAMVCLSGLSFARLNQSGPAINAQGSSYNLNTRKLNIKGDNFQRGSELKA